MPSMMQCWQPVERGQLSLGSSFILSRACCHRLPLPAAKMPSGTCEWWTPDLSAVGGMLCPCTVFISGSFLNQLEKQQQQQQQHRPPPSPLLLLLRPLLLLLLLQLLPSAAAFCC